jgi:serine/threonine-protein kinase RsbW
MLRANMRAQQTMLRLPSNPCHIGMLESFVAKMVEYYKISPDKFGDILVSITEAVNNAIIHGNRQDESKVVQIQLCKHRDCIAIRVTDEGKGFDYRKLPDPTCPENRRTLGGRGVFLMRQLADKLRFDNNGSTVEIHFKL